MEILNIFFYWKIKIFLNVLHFIIFICVSEDVCMFVWTCMYVYMCVHVHISVIVDQWRSEDRSQFSLFTIQELRT